MDTRIENSKRLITPKRLILLVGSVMLIALTLIFNTRGEASISAKSIRLGHVQKGNLEIIVRASGTVRSGRLRFVASQQNATVKEILVVSGQVFSKGTPLLRLASPSLQQSLKEANAKLVSAQSDAQLKTATLTAERLDKQLNVIELESEIASMDLQLSAEKELLKSELVSLINYKKTQIKADLLAKRLDVQRQRLANFAQLEKVQLAANKTQIEVLKVNKIRYEQALNELLVRAESGGIVKQVMVNVGEQVTIGKPLLKLASNDVLYAALKIPESRVSEVELGAEVKLNGFSGQFNGKVSRVDPIIENNIVTLYVDFIGDLPSGLSFDTQVNGEIKVKRILNTLFIQRPSAVIENSDDYLFRVQEGSDGLALRTAVEFGAASLTEIEIKSGLQENDVVILSDLSELSQHQSITVDDYTSVD